MVVLVNYSDADNHAGWGLEQRRGKSKVGCGHGAPRVASVCLFVVVALVASYLGKLGQRLASTPSCHQLAALVITNKLSPLFTLSPWQPQPTRSRPLQTGSVHFIVCFGRCLVYQSPLVFSFMRAAVAPAPL